MTTCPQCGRRAQPGDAAPLASTSLASTPLNPARMDRRPSPAGWTPIWFLPRTHPTPDAHGLLRA